MSVDPRLFLFQAEHLVSACREGKTVSGVATGIDADLRTAISRSYYAAFLICHAFVEGLGFKIVGTGKAHEVVPDALDGSGFSSLVTVASDLKSLRTERNRADYNMGFDGWTDLLQTSHDITKRSGKIISAIDAMNLQFKTNNGLKVRVNQAIRKFADGLEQNEKHHIRPV